MFVDLNYLLKNVYMKTRIILMIAASALLFFSSCNRNSSPIEQTALDLADDDAVTGAVFDDIFSSADNAGIMLDDAMKNGDSKSATLSGDSCPVVTVEHPLVGVWPKTIIIDYGTGCTGLYDNTRSGKIIMKVTGPRREKGSIRTITFDEYHFNGIRVEGTKVHENLGLNENQNIVMAITLSGGRLILPGEKSIERSFAHEREWIAGFMTRNIWDDECLVTGTANGKNAEGIAYTRTIMSALHWSRACRFILSGTVMIEREGVEPFGLDYGTGECDNKATVTRGDETKEILLKHRHRKMVP